MGIADYYDRGYIEGISERIADIHPAFDMGGFASDVSDRLEDRTYTERMCIIAEGLYRYLPDYGTSLDVFNAMLGERMPSMSAMYDFGMPYAPFGKFIELYAVQNPDYFDRTVAYIHELTQRYTGEFAMRPLLASFPERTLAVIDGWVDDESDCVRRLCSECMRVSIPWGPRLRFALDHFDGYCDILVRLADDDCEYVRRSVANNINELCKVDIEKAMALIERIGAVEDERIRSVITHGTRWARKKGIL